MIDSLDGPRLGLATLLLNAAATFWMVGLIWFVQVVHYPLFSKVGTEGFAAYEARHAGRTTWVVAPPMLIELVTSVLLIWFRPPGVPAWLVYFGIATVVVNWASTAFVQVPLHGRLAGGFDAAAHGRLVATNAVRTAAWSLHGAAVLAMLYLAMRHPAGPSA